MTQSPPRQYGPQYAPASTIRRSATNSTRPVSRGDTTPAIGCNGDGNIWSAYQAINHIPLRPGLEQTDVITPQTQFSQDAATATCERQLGNADLRKLGPRRLRLEHRTVLGDVARQRDRRSRSTGIRPPSSSSGTITAAGTITSRRRTSTTTDSACVCRCSIISPYAKQGYVSHVHYEHGSILRFIEDQFGLPRLTASDSRANLPERLLRFLAVAAEVPAISGAL